MRIARVLTTLLALLAVAEARAACTDPAAVEAAWTAIDDACPCASAATRGTYVACATQAVKARIAGGSLPSSCRRDALRHAKLSVCGRPGAAVCCRIATTNGRDKHRVSPSAARCTSTPRVSACVSAFPSVPTGCDAGGCIEPVCGNGLVEPGEECDSTDFRRCDGACQRIECALPPTACGNGVVDPGEACEPPGAGACNAECQPASCGAPLPGEIAVACAQPALTSAVSLGAGSDGDGYLIAWRAVARRSSTDVVARRYDADAVPVDTQVRVLSDDAPCGLYWNDQLAVGSDGQSYYATWASYGTAATDFSMVSGRRVDADGTMRASDDLAWGPRIGFCSIIHEGPTAVTGAGPGRFVAAWSRSAWCTSGSIPGPDAATLTFAGSGAPTRTAFDIYFPPSSEGASTSTASLASLGDDTIAVWRAGRMNPTPPPVEEGFIVQRWTDPELDTSPILSAGESVEAGRPVAVDGDGQLLVAWRQVFPPSVDRIVATRVASTGEALDPMRIVIATTPSGVAAGPVAAFDGTVWLVVWVEASELRAVAVRADGTVVDSTPRVLATGVAPTEPAAASTGDGRVLVVYGRPDGAATAIRGMLVPGS
jgi:hypothetical protein